MAKFRQIRNSLIAGEISPTAFGRTDLPQYQHACKTLRNMIPLLTGGAYRRPGTFFEKKYQTDETVEGAGPFYAPRLFPFVFSETEAYCIALSVVRGSLVNNFHAFRPTGNTSSVSITNISNSTEYLRTELDEIQFVQSADVMWLLHPNWKPRKLQRTAVDTFSVVDFDYGLTGANLREAYPYRNQNDTSITMAPSHTSGSNRTLTASSAFFDELHVGAIIKIDDGAGIAGCAIITAFTSSTQVTIDVIVDFGTTSARTTWWESAWSNYRGWPRTAAFFQSRLCYGGNAAMPDSIWCSQTDNYGVMSKAFLALVGSAGDGSTTGPAGEDPFTITISSQQINIIQWLSSEKNLFVGTTGDEIAIDFPDGSTTGFSVESKTVTVQSHYGSAYIPPARVGTELIFAPKVNDSIISLVFDWSQQTYSADPLQLFYDEKPEASPQTGLKGYRTFAWDKGRSTLWCCDKVGNLFGMTHERKVGVTAWHSHRMGGYDADQIDSDTGCCAGSVVSLAIVPNPVLGTPDLWLTVVRYIDGAFAYHVERMIGKNLPLTSAFNTVTTGIPYYFADASVCLSNGLVETPGTGDTSWNAFSHLEGEVLQGLAFGANGIFSVKSTEVTAGVADLDGALPGGYNNRFVSLSLGLPYDSVIEPVRSDAGSQIGTAQGAIKRIHEASIRFYRTLSAKIGRDADNLETVIFREGSTLMGRSPELYTGDKLIKPDTDYDRDGGIYITQDKCLPFTVVAIITEGITADG